MKRSLMFLFSFFLFLIIKYHFIFSLAISVSKDLHNKKLRKTVFSVAGCENRNSLK